MKYDSKKEKRQKDICLQSCKYAFSLLNLRKKFQINVLEEMERTPEPAGHARAIKTASGS